MLEDVRTISDYNILNELMSDKAGKLIDAELGLANLANAMHDPSLMNADAVRTESEEKFTFFLNMFQIPFPFENEGRTVLRIRVEALVNCGQ